MGIQCSLRKGLGIIPNYKNGQSNGCLFFLLVNKKATESVAFSWSH